MRRGERLNTRVQVIPCDHTPPYNQSNQLMMVAYSLSIPSLTTRPAGLRNAGLSVTRLHIPRLSKRRVSFAPD